MERLSERDAAIAQKKHSERIKRAIEVNGLRDDEIDRLSTLSADDPTSVLDLETRAAEIRERRDGGEDFSFKMPGEEGYDPEAARFAEYERIDEADRLAAERAKQAHGKPAVGNVVTVS